MTLPPPSPSPSPSPSAPPPTSNHPPWQVATALARFRRVLTKRSTSPDTSNKPNNNNTPSDVKQQLSGNVPRGTINTGQPKSAIFGVPLADSLAVANTKINLVCPPPPPPPQCSCLDAGSLAPPTATPFNPDNTVSWARVPLVIAKLGNLLKSEAVETEGLFRKVGSQRRMKALQAAFEQPPDYGRSLHWASECYTVHDAACVLRRYITSLPEPLVPEELWESFRNVLADQASEPLPPLSSYRGSGERQESVSLSSADQWAAASAASGGHGMMASRSNVSFRPASNAITPTSSHRTQSLNSATVTTPSTSGPDAGPNVPTATTAIPDPRTAVLRFNALIQQCPLENRYLLLYLLDLLSVFAQKSDVNLMTANNLAVIFQPGFFWHRTLLDEPREHQLAVQVLEFLIQHQTFFALGCVPGPQAVPVPAARVNASNHDGPGDDESKEKQAQRSSHVPTLTVPTPKNPASPATTHKPTRSSHLADESKYTFKPKFISVTINPPLASEAKPLLLRQSNVLAPVQPTSGVQRSKTFSPRFRRSKHQDRTVPSEDGPVDVQRRSTAPSRLGRGERRTMVRAHNLDPVPQSYNAESIHTASYVAGELAHADQPQRRTRPVSHAPSSSKPSLSVKDPNHLDPKAQKKSWRRTLKNFSLSQPLHDADLGRSRSWSRKRSGTISRSGAAEVRPFFTATQAQPQPQPKQDVLPVPSTIASIPSPLPTSLPLNPLPAAQSTTTPTTPVPAAPASPSPTAAPAPTPTRTPSFVRRSVLSFRTPSGTTRPAMTSRSTSQRAPNEFKETSGVARSSSTRSTRSSHASRMRHSTLNH